MKNALIVVDVQNDFCKGGALAVRDADSIVPLINRDMKLYDFIVFTQDWHPPDHGSFAMFHPQEEYEMGELNGVPQMMWPVHCVQDTFGAKFHPHLNVPKTANVIWKGKDKNVDSYSAFADSNGQKTGLDLILKARQITAVFICGLAMDYCVKYTAIDAVKAGYKTYVLRSHSRGVGLSLVSTYDEMLKEGIVLL